MNAVTNILNVSQVYSGYGTAMVLNSLDLQISSGEVYAILGKNGMGKSTLLKTLMGFIQPKQGDIQFYGNSIKGWAPDRIARHKVAYIPQEKALFQDLSVRDNLGLALIDNKEFSSRFAAIKDFFPFLKERLHQKAGTLSGGEQKMLLIARALIIRPKLILIDEITEGMQPSVIERLIRILRSDCEQFGTTLLLVEQNTQFALAVADRYSVLELGTIVGSGSTHDTDAHARIVDHLTV